LTFSNFFKYISLKVKETNKRGGVLVNQEIIILYISAASIGFFHTLFGPNHYLPFIVISKARKWSIQKTLWITFLCGIGHVGSSIILGGIGIVLGISITRLKPLENLRGNFAAWLLIAFGLVYLIWGLRKVVRNKPHEHIHYHSDGIMHSHKHTHTGEHAHIQTGEMTKNLTPWILFVIFILGPC
jgi:nickel/cobalt exporter